MAGINHILLQKKKNIHVKDNLKNYIERGELLKQIQDSYKTVEMDFHVEPLHHIHQTTSKMSID